MEKFDWDKALQPVDISEEAKATVPIEQEIWNHFLAVSTPNSKEHTIQQYPSLPKD
jgi:hypothetical protein